MAQAPEEEEDTAATPMTGDGKGAEAQDRREPDSPEEPTPPRPRGHRTKGQAPREGNPRTPT